MKRKTLLVGFVSVVVVVFAGVIAVTAQGPRPVGTLRVTSPLPVGTGFTYQGQLKSSGAPVNATCDFIFKLYDDPTAGAQVGSNVGEPITVTNGLFTTALDFGAGAFTGDARWLDMQMRCPTGVGGYIPLTPRQGLTPAPMALALPGLWTEQNGTSPNLIGGFSGNIISPSVSGATIGGGGLSVAINRIASPGDYATIGGGRGNTASAVRATVGGGANNTTSGDSATVGGGYNNMASALRATVGGGVGNTASGINATVGGGYGIMASGDHATVGGGYNNMASGVVATVGGGDHNTASGINATVGGGAYNMASGNNATVGGGANNTASGDYSFAAGHLANTNHHGGAFVWGDNSVTTEISATAPNQFLIRAAGGVGVNTNAPLANTLTVNGQIIGGGTMPPAGTEPFTAEGSSSGISMDDRGPGTFPRWVMYPQAGELRFFAGGTDRVMISTGGILTATGGFSGQCLSSGSFSTSGSNACNMDVAEAFASVDRTEPGDVVALVTQPAGGRSPAAGPTVRKASRADGGLVVGVVSSNPGLVFDNGQTHLAGDNSQLITADRTVVALVGRVPVKASLENGPIAVGDPLTGASAAGFAMRATQAGQIIGYALQSSDELSEGKLLAWLQPGLYVPPAQVARLNASTAEPESAALATRVVQVQTRNAALEHQNAELEARVAALEQASQANAMAGRAADSGIPITWLFFGGMIVLGVVALRRRS